MFGWLVIFLSVMLAQASCDTSGTEFIVAFPEMLMANGRVQLYVTTAKRTRVNVVIETPGFTQSVISDRTFTITLGKVKRVGISVSIRMNATSKDSKGILVTASDDISLYGFNKGTVSVGAFLALPTDVLGKRYYAITYYPPRIQCQVLVAAVYNSTVVNIRLGTALGNDSVQYEGRVYTAGETITINMDRCDTFQFQSQGDLSGSYVTSDKIIAVFSGNIEPTMGYEESTDDHVCEQLIPVEMWGTCFIALPFPLGSHTKFVASEGSTTVTVTGASTILLTLGRAGDVGEFDIPPDVAYSIFSDKPIMLIQFSNSVSETNLRMTAILSVEQFVNKSAWAVPIALMDMNYFMFVIRKSDINQLVVDGNSMDNITLVNVGMEYVVGSFEVTEGFHYVELQSSTFAGYLFGYGGWKSYGMPVSMCGYNQTCGITTEDTRCGNGTPTAGVGANHSQSGLNITTTSPKAGAANHSQSGQNITTRSPNAGAANHSQSGQNTTSCQCRPCRASTNYTTEELISRIEELKSQLGVPKNTTTSYTRARTSAKDDRPSSHAIGYVGYAIFAALGVGLLVVDAGNLLLMFKTIKRNLRR